MSSATMKSFLKGVRHGSPFLLVAAPFSMLFGVVATDAGLDIAQVMAFTTLVIAGAAQFAAVQLMIDDAGVAMVLLGALAVNVRMAMYSAALVPHLGAAPLWKRAMVAYLLFDQTYTVSQNEYDAFPQNSTAQKFAYFIGSATLMVPTWIGMAYVGAVIGASIPPEYALDFALPITFLAMMGPALRTMAHVAAALVSIVVALLLSGLPSGAGLLIAAVLAMMTGAFVETRMEKRAKPDQVETDTEVPS